MENSPFIFGSTVSKIAFTNRHEESEKLLKNLENGINTILISPRRWGKSSLVDHVAYKMGAKGSPVKIVQLDMFAYQNEKEFLENFAKAVIKVTASKWEEWLELAKSVFKKVVPQISVSPYPTSDFSIGISIRDIEMHSDEILDLPEKIAEKKNIRLAICIDEFQDIVSFKNFERFEKKMRSIWQKHQRVSYCLYGSKRHMMNDIFNNSSKPFYRFGDFILLDKIETKYWIPFIVESFKNSKRSINKQQAQTITTLMRRHPWYVQQLSHYVWMRCTRKVADEDIKDSLDELIRANSPLYINIVESLSPTQLRLLMAVCNEEKQLTSTKTMEKYQLGTPNNVLKSKTKLETEDIIQKHDDLWEFLDPAFELWFRKTYLNEAYFRQLPADN